MRLEAIEENNQREKARERERGRGKGRSETKEDPVARSVLSLPVELYLHGVTCPINREHYSPVDGLRIRWRP